MKMNCIIVDDEEMSRNALKHLIEQVPFLHLVKICEQAEEVAGVLKNEKVDLMFLDVEMPGMNGLELIRSLETSPLVIMTTAHKEYALDAFDNNVVDYLVKPILLPRFMQAVSKVKEYFDNSRNNLEVTDKDYFFIKNNSVMNKVLLKEILWIEALGDYLTINTANKKYILHFTLKAIMEKLPADKFVRVHRSFIVAIDNITSVEDTTICIGSKLIPVGAIYKEDFLKHLNLL